MTLISEQKLEGTDSRSSYLLTSEEESLVDDLGEHSRIAISMPVAEHMDHWYKFYLSNYQRLENNRTPILICYEGDFIDPKDMFSIFGSIGGNKV